jgi:hypothetical protein
MLFEEKIKIVEQLNSETSFWLKYCFDNSGKLFRIDLSYDLDGGQDFVIWLKNKKTDIESHVDIIDIKEIQKNELVLFSKIFELFDSEA